MSALGELLDGAVRADAERLTGVAFATDRFALVRGRVARRRAARSAGVGGASVLGIGALAVGVTHLPFASPGLAGPGYAVVCTTVAAAAPTPSADSALSVLNVPSPSGSVIWSIAIGSQDPPEIVANIALDLTTHEVTGSIPDGNSYVYTSLTLTKNADGMYAARLPDGTPLTFEVKDENLVLKGSTLEPMGEPTVTCVTVDPAPTSSAVPSSSLEPSATPVATQTTRPVAIGDTPFQCGYLFASDESGTDALRVSGSPTTDSAIHQVFEQWYGEQAPTTEVGDTGAIGYHASLGSADVTGSSSSRDPASHESVQTSETYDMPSLGFTFVAVKDGVVVGTVVPQEDGSTPGMLADRNDTAAPSEAFLWDLAALTPCGSASIDGAQIYAVAGFGQDGNFAYSWMKISE